MTNMQKCVLAVTKLYAAALDASPYRAREFDECRDTLLDNLTQTAPEVTIRPGKIDDLQKLVKSLQVHGTRESQYVFETYVKQLANLTKQIIEEAGI